MTLTVWSASALVVAARLWLLARRALAVTNAEHASKAGITKNHSNRFPFERGAGFCGTVSEVSCSIATEVSNCLVIKSSRILSNQVLRFLLSADHGEYNWNKEESCDGGEQQSANNRAAEGRILFTSLAESEGHGHHADDHRESGHHHGPEPSRAGLEGRAEGILGLGETLVRKRDDQNAVGRGHADAHDRAHQRGHVQGCARQEKHPANSRKSTRQSGDDDESLRPRLEIHNDEQVDEHDRKDQSAKEPGEGRVHGGNLSAGY